VRHRHLLPQEIDLLLDGEAGFGLQPLKAHVRECAECRAELEAARELVLDLEHLPHFAPSAAFADRVMANVQVFEPVHVAARDSVRRWLPQSRPMQVLAGAMAASTTLVLSIGALWLLGRADLLLFVTQTLGERARGALVAGAGRFISAAFGDAAVTALGTGGASGVAIAATALVATVIASAFGLRALASAARRHRGS
jgi:hypothetical protein